MSHLVRLLARTNAKPLQFGSKREEKAASTGSGDPQGSRPTRRGRRTLFHVRRSPCNPRPCASCSRPTTEPRRGLCFACYLRAYRGHVADGACAACGLEDRRVLRRHRLADGLATLCANHAAIAGRRTLTLEALRAECYPPGDRRQGEQRRADRRAVGDRRTAPTVEQLLAVADERRHAGRRAADAPFELVFGDERQADKRQADGAQGQPRAASSASSCSSSEGAAAP